MNQAIQHFHSELYRQVSHILQSFINFHASHFMISVQVYMKQARYDDLNN